MGVEGSWFERCGVERGWNYKGKLVLELSKKLRRVSFR